ncbi:SH3 domain-containing protein [Alisedimentitalea sp. MJ-SS2]|uniref:SH3 domain-containing protein n=1 Tax=Aliisedimentitalea sp. MJ-SS2 TaxID=3049795 RepID=UPI002908B932|nr:SH3 domain-containing protein [Alisedimentitalea sp. MJ-SS2]MDU8927084.1 SH3 domain-containing protein [Alisedimentitalea sp. MJ-SS2]
MWRLIVITFGFMGFAFYELSGGSDYKPSERSRQHAATQAAQPPATPVQRPVRDTGNAQILLASASPSNMEQPTPRRSTVVSDAEKRLRLTLNTAQTAVPASATTHGVTTVAANPDKIARLVAAAGAARPQAQPKTDDAVATDADDNRDLRKVKSARVNMRQGPGKTFNVVAKLTRGTEVEVIRDGGDGWVKLRVLDTGRVGWMADFLLVATN